MMRKRRAARRIGWSTTAAFGSLVLTMASCRSGEAPASSMAARKKYAPPNELAEIVRTPPLAATASPFSVVLRGPLRMMDPRIRVLTTPIEAVGDVDLGFRARGFPRQFAVMQYDGKADGCRTVAAAWSRTHLVTLVIDGVENQVEIPIRAFETVERRVKIKTSKSKLRVRPETLVVQSTANLRFASSREEFSIGVRYMTARGAKTVEVRSIDGVASLEGVFATVDSYGLETSVSYEGGRPRVWTGMALEDDDDVRRIPQRKYLWTTVSLRDAASDEPIVGAHVVYSCSFGSVDTATDEHGEAYVPASEHAEDPTSRFPPQDSDAWGWALVATHDDYRATMERCAGPRCARPIPKTIKMRRNVVP